MSEIFNEDNMKNKLNKYISKEDELLAGIHAVSIESKVLFEFKGCGLDRENWIIGPMEAKDGVQISKKKYCNYDIYLGITKNSVVIVECNPCDYYYQMEYIEEENTKNAIKVDKEISLREIGKCFSYSEIESCKIKKGWLGSIKCHLKLKNGGYFKLMIPKLAGLGNGMPNYKEDKEKIIEKLKNISS